MKKIVTIFIVTITSCLVAYGQKNGSNDKTPPPPPPPPPAPPAPPRPAPTPGTDPVTITGDWYHNATDLSFFILGNEFGFTRTYHSTGEFSRSLGHKWCHNFDTHLLQQDNGNILWITTEGLKQTFIKNKKLNFYTTGYTYYPILEHLDDGTYSLKMHYGDKLTFNAGGQLIAIHDRNDNITSCNYNAKGYLAKVTGPAGSGYTIVNDSTGKIMSIEDHTGRRVNYKYNDKSDLIQVTLPEETINHYDYDRKHRLISLSIPSGETYTFAYDRQNRMIKNTDPAGYSEIFKYPGLMSISKNKQVFIDKRGFKWKYKYNRYGNITQSHLSDGQVIRKKYDKHQNLIKETYPNAGIVKKQYDERGNITALYNQEGDVTYYTYDETHNQVTSITDVMGNISSYAYDKNGNKLKYTDALGNSYTYTYNTFGLCTSITDPNGHTTRYHYNKYGNREQIDHPLGDEKFVYDNLGKMVNYIDALGNTYHLVYDKLNRLITVTDPSQGITNYTYDKNSNIETVTDANGNITNYISNALNQIVRVETDNKVTSYIYDGSGNLMSFTNPNGHTTSRTYSYNNQILTETSPLGNSTIFAYDVNGNRVKRIDANGIATLYTYDILNRLVKQQFGNDTEIYGYNKNGNLTSATNALGSHTFVYDSLGRIIEKHNGPFGKNIQYRYDKAGNKVAMVNPEGKITSYKYDANSRLVELIDPYGKTTVFEYYNNGLLKQQDNGNGTFTSYIFNNLGRITNLAHYNTSGQALEYFKYTYDKVGNRLSTSSINDQVTNYNYDKSYQLVGVKYPDGDEEHFEYDKAGNRIMVDINTDIKTYMYNADNQLIQAGKQLYIYDKNGNLIEEKKENTSRSFKYDGENRQIAITQDGKLIKRYQYNPIGQIQMEENEAGSLIQFIYDGFDVLQQSNSDGKSTYFINGLYTDQHLSLYTGGQHFYFHTDALNSTSLLTNSQQLVTNSYQYYAYGEVKQQASEIMNPYTFTGRKYEANIDLYNYRSRYYSASLGRFITKDVYKGRITAPFTLNYYLYTANNPSNYTDPYGFDPSKPPPSTPPITPQTPQPPPGGRITDNSGNEDSRIWHPGSSGNYP